MTAATLPLQALLLTFSGWVNRHQGDVIEYLIEENRVLRGQMGKRRLQLTDDQRRRLAAKEKILGRRALSRKFSTPPPGTLAACTREGGRELAATLLCPEGDGIPRLLAPIRAIPEVGGLHHRYTRDAA